MARRRFGASVTARGDLVIVDWRSGSITKQLAVTIGQPEWVPSPDVSVFSAAGDEQFVLTDGSWKVFGCREVMNAVAGDHEFDGKECTVTGNSVPGIR